MHSYAGIGSRRLSAEEKLLIYKVGKYMAEQGWELRTGAAQGADQCFAEGALSVGGAVTLCLPWRSYEQEWVAKAVQRGAKVEVLSDHDRDAFASVERLHPTAAKLSQAVKRLHARNYRIIAPAVFTIAWPKPTNWGGLGGTGQGILLTQEFGRQCIRLDTPEGQARIAAKLS